MADKTELRKRLEYWRSVYQKLQEAYVALVEGGVKSYMIDDRQLTRFDLGVLRREMQEAEDKINALEAAVDGKPPRKSVGVVPRDW